MQWTITKRPTKLSDLYGLDNVKKYFYAKAPKMDWPKAVFLKGMFGSGKSTVSKILAQMYVCDYPENNGDPCCKCASCKSIIEERYDRDVMVIDGGQSSKAEVIDSINEFISTAPFYDRRKVVIIEEVQELSKAAQNSLLKTLEHPSKDLHFILLTMEQSGIPTGFNSRCVPFVFKKASVEELMLYMKKVMEEENLWKDESIPKEFKFKGLSSIASGSNGSIRQALQSLETCLTGKFYTQDEILENMGLADEAVLNEIITDILNGNAEVFGKLNKFDGHEFFSITMKILSESFIFKSSGFLVNEEPFFANQIKAVGSHKNFNFLLDEMNKLSPNTKPFLRKSDLLISICNVFEKIKASKPLETLKEECKDIPVRPQVRPVRS